MKELSTEEKARAYDEATKVIKNNLDALNEITETGAEVVNIQSIKNCFYRAFPELKESEDERIRKAIIETLPKYGYLSQTSIKVKDAIAWLERQGEREPDIRYKYLDELLAADDIYQMSMNEAMTNGAKIKAVSALSKMCISELLGLEKQKEQKPAWSEEDERMKNAAIRACKYMIDNFENSTKDYEDAIAWLEKQKPVEWSEKDIKITNY